MEDVNLQVCCSEYVNGTGSIPHLIWAARDQVRYDRLLCSVISALGFEPRN